MDLTTVARVNLRREAGAGDDSAMLGSLITAVSADFAAYLGRHTEAVSRTEDYTLKLRGTRLRLRGYPVTKLDIASVIQSTTRGFVTFLTPDVARYDVIENTGELLFYDVAPYKPTFVRVQYTGGMATDTDAFIAAYPQIAMAADDMVLVRFERLANPGATAIQTAQGSVGFEKVVDMLPSARRVLDQYRRRAI